MSTEAEAVRREIIQVSVEQQESASQVADLRKHWAPPVFDANAVHTEQSAEPATPGQAGPPTPVDVRTPGANGATADPVGAAVAAVVERDTAGIHTIMESPSRDDTRSKNTATPRSIRPPVTAGMADLAAGPEHIRRMVRNFPLFSRIFCVFRVFLCSFSLVSWPGV